MHIISYLPRIAPSWVALIIGLSAYVPVARAQTGSDSAPKTAQEEPTESAEAARSSQPSAEEKAAAKTALAAGDAALAANDHAKALEEYTKANNAVPTIHAAYGIAMALSALDKKAEAYDALTALLATEGTDRLGEEKLERAQEQLTRLQQTPGHLAVTTIPAGAQLAVDGKPQAGAPPRDIELLPGPHTVSVSAEGYMPQEVQVAIRPTATTEQSVELEKEPEPTAAAPAAPPPIEEPEPAPAPPPPQPRSKAPAYVTLGIAGAGAIVGTIFGVKALGAKSDFDDNKTTGNADAVERNALIADMAFGVAITLGITGIVLLTTDDEPSEVSAQAPRPARKERARLQVTPYAGPKGGGAAAQFVF